MLSRMASDFCSKENNAKLLLINCYIFYKSKWLIYYSVFLNIIWTKFK